ncbi:MAG: acyl transferase domain-containing protein/acyl carrier protein [Myxococcota bacterium]|jgi:acyl transferase domain-containing protein/acyl carrier protein
MSQDGAPPLSPLKKALLAVQGLKTKLAEAEGARREPIAVVGVGLRLPGGATDLASYWQLLRDGVDAISEVPPDRWDVDALYDPDPAAPGKMITRNGGFLGDVSRFDAGFFGISPREAVEMDPAQRLLLEVAWEALENGHLPADGLARSKTGVFVGLGLSDYGRRHFLGDQPEVMTAYSGTGAFLSVAAGRIAYTLGLQGPAVTVDTACSSSLVSIHLAVQSLRSGESDLALAGGANMLLAPEPTIYFSKLQALAPDGRCKTFDASADGYARGEGAGMVVLERLSDAVKNGRRILGVIRGTAVNQDGRSNGLTAPSGRAQQQVVRQALENGGLTPADVDYVEAHGTGTPLGDPIELDALKAVFGTRDGDRPLFVGSAKTNFGHLETAAGIAGFVKLLLTLDGEGVPPHLHLTALNPRIQLDGTPLRIPTAFTPWEGERRRIGGVSSFGLSGTNAHIVVESPPHVEAPEPVASPAVLTLSARSDAGRRALAASYVDALSTDSLPTLAHGALVGRSHLSHRLAVAASDAAEARDRLSAWITDGQAVGVSTGEVAGLPPEVVFLFTGQGSQYPGMGRALYASDAVFRTAWDEAAAAVDTHLDVPLASVVFPESDDDTRIHLTQYTQPALFVLQVALARTWAARGVTCDVAVGHSIGELAAAYVAGVFSLEDAAKLVVERGRLMGALPRDGAMLAVFADEPSVAAVVADHAGDVDISGLNNPSETVVSGKIAAIDAIEAHFDAAGVKTRRLRVSHAFHSPLMAPMLDAFEAVARSITYSRPSIPVVSNLTGSEETEALTDPMYWVRHVRHAVRFATGMETLRSQGHSLFLELGPRPILSGMGARCYDTTPATWLASLDRAAHDGLTLLAAAGGLHTAGIEVDLGVQPAPAVDLPPMAWQRERYWLEPLERAATTSDPLAEMVVVLKWRPAAAAVVPPGDGLWAVLGDGDALAAALEARGRRVTRTVTPDVEGVVFSALDASADHSPTLAAFAAARAMADTQARLWLITPGVHAGSEAGLWASPLWGLGRVLALEQPERWGGHVDVAGPVDAGAVADRLLTGGGPFLLKDGRALEGRLARSRGALGATPPTLDGTWLVTGGYGDLGRRTCTWLADQGVRTLCLFSRSGPGSEAATAMLDALAARGVRVHQANGDVTNPKAVQAVVARLSELRGVVHVAGTNDDALLADQTDERVERVLAAKVTGAWNLHQATAELDLQAFVCFGSAAATLGVPGQANYAAANAYLDALCRYRRASGKPGLSLGYGPWTEGAMVEGVGDAVRARWAEEGIRLLDAEDALAVLGRALSASVADPVVAPFDWVAYAASRPAPLPLLFDLGGEPEAVDGGLVAELRGTPSGARRARLSDVLAGVVGKVLGFPAGQPIDPKRGFFDAGMDSLMAMDLRTRLQSAVGVPLSATLAFDHANVNALADHLLGVLDLVDPSAQVVTAQTVARDLGEPIAIVGAACRFPGGVTDPESFWAMLASGTDAVRRVPTDRFDVDRYFDPAPATPGKLYAREGGFVDGIELFDAAHFGISPREAASLDPQQRWLLETSWHALEHAGIAPASLEGSATGVYVGIGFAEYGRRFEPTATAVEVDAYSGTGNETSFAAGRVSYALGLRGPAMAVNTACSSSLVSLHMAVQALRAGECTLALAGGVNAIVGPETTIQMSQLRALAPDSRCKSFDHRADGYVRGEGAGMVVLKRLSDAIAADDAILAVIEGSAINHDGRSSGLTVPSGAAQQAVLRSAWADAGLDPADADYVECHGTGTKLGDPIEIRALGEVMTAGRPADRPLGVGSVKTNVGHLEAGAGIIGVLKVVASLQAGRIPPHLHFEAPNPALPLDEFPIQVTAEGRDWAPGERRRLAGVSSFGISGTNAHIVLGEAPTRAEVDASTDRPLTLLTLSARTDAGVVELAQQVHDRLAEGGTSLADAAYTLNVGRSHLAARAAVIGADRDAVLAQLAKVAAGKATISGKAEAARPVFLCTGAGPQRVGMARSLYETEPVFRAALDECARLLEPHLERPLLDVLYSDETDAESPLHSLAYTQPAMFALDWSMAQLWASWGVEPAAVIGHSTGQFPAAALAGVFSLEDGLRLMAIRGRLMSSGPPEGSMVACFTTPARVAAALEGHEERAGVAAVNGPEEVVISGYSDPVDGIAAALEAEGIEVRKLNISHAAHSMVMDPILAEYEAVVRSITLHPPRLPLIENVRGAVAGDEVTDPAYWVRHMRQGVQFLASMETLAELGYRHFLELGNHPILSGNGARCLEGQVEARWYPSLRRKTDDWSQLLETVGRMYSAGVDIDWQRFHTHAPGRVQHLPLTPFQRKRHWVDRPQTADEAAGRVGDDWLYRIDWEGLEPAAAGRHGPVLLVGEGDWLAEALAARLDRPVVCVSDARELRAEGENWTADFGEPEHLAAVVEASGAEDVVCLEALGPWLIDPISSATAGTRASLHLIQAAAARRGVRVLLVTRGARSVAGEAIANVHQAPLIGLGNVATVELPDLRVVRVDLDPAGGDDVGNLLTVLDSDDAEDQVAFRKGLRHVPRLVRDDAVPTDPPELRPGTWWITGGYGALGLRAAGWLVDNGATHLVLTNRSEPSEEAAAAIDRLREKAVVSVIPGDVGAAGEVPRILAASAEAGNPDLVGVVHAAGVLDDGSILRFDWDRFVGVWGPKVAGAWNLHRATLELDLQAFVLFSSAASMIGSAGQANYAAGNAFMDALAHHRRALGLPAQSQCWGPWGKVGLATETKRAWEAGGVFPLVPAQGVAVMGRLLGHTSAQVGITHLDWNTFGPHLVFVPGYLSLLVPKVEAAPAAAMADTLRSTEVSERRRVLVDGLAEHVGAILGLEAHEVEPSLGFFDAGMDSLMAVELVSRLKGELGVSLPATLAFDHPTVDLLADYLLADALELDAPEAAPVVAASAAVDEPIAVVGIACRMPGGASTPEAFWELLRSGRDPMIPVPPDRWDIDAYYDPTPATPGKMYTREASFIDGVDQFDPEFFNISPREAASMDPQQRLMLEVSWEALERARMATPQLKGSRVAVFVGVGDSGYLQRFQRPGGALYADTYAGTGSLSAFVSGRVAYALGVHGPNLALNTACSSSLVASHLGVQALRHGECEAALVGGVHLMLSPENFVYVSQLKALASDGRCKTFDASADGYGRAEACGMLVLKRLSDAHRDGNPVLAVIRGSAVNHDGPSSGLTVPYGPAQRMVIREAITRAGVDPLDVTYLEAHGTGTVLGDPIEVHAVEAEYCKGRTADNPLHLGAAKANIGHAEVAAGAVSLVKMTLALHAGVIPPLAHFTAPNPDLDLEGSHLQVDTVPVPWTTRGQPRMTGVSSFGLGGTNAHVVLAEAPDAPALPAKGDSDRTAHLLTLSGRDAAALRDQAARYGDLLSGGGDLADVAWSVHTTRMPWEHRLAVVAVDAADAGRKLASFVAEGSAQSLTTGVARTRRPRVAFLFSGQGSQYVGMGRGLYDTDPTFRESVDRCAAILDPLLDRAILDVIFAEPADEAVNDTRYTQPALFVIEYSLAQVWRSWGVQPDVVIGHSIGELVAACVAGVFSLADGLRLVVARGAGMADLPRDGAMYAAFADEDVVRAAMEPHGDAVSVAGINNPTETVISGRTEAVHAVADALKADGVDGRHLTVSHAFHSALMDPMLDAFERVAASITMQPPVLPLISNADGQLAGDRVTEPSYWRNQVRQAVRFLDGVRTLDDMGITVCVECGPHPTLCGNIRRSQLDMALLPSLKRDADDTAVALGALGALWARGGTVDWRAYDAPWTRWTVDLPTYPFQRRRIWMDAEEWPGRKAAYGDWLVAPTWLRRDAPGVSAPSGRWVLLADPGGVGAALAEVLRARGAAVEVVQGVPDDLSLLVGAAAVVYLAGLGATEPDATAVDAAWGLTRVVQALDGTSTRLRVVTRGVQAIGDHAPTFPGQATLWGLARVVRLEHGAQDCRIVDLHPEPGTSGESEALADALLSADDEPELALRDGRWIARLAPVDDLPKPIDVSGEGAWLVTGGLGDLGREVARWLSGRGASHVVLTSRRPPSDAAKSVIADLEAAGTTVLVAQGDVAVAEDVARILTEVDAMGVRLRGVVHAAGVLSDGLLVNQEQTGFARVFGPKLHGTMALHAATVDRDLDAFVLFSGGASLMGSPGQGNYAAANAFEDAFAHWRRAQGLRAVSLNWGAWAEVGMAARLGVTHAKRQAAEGIRQIPVADGMAALGALLDHPSSQIGVLPVDWPMFVEVFHGGKPPPFLRGLVRGTGAVVAAATAAGANTETAAPAEDGLLGEVQGLSEPERKAAVDAFVHRKAIEVLDLPRDRVIDREQPLIELGLDSLLAVELKNALMDGGVDLPVARVMTGPAIDTLTAMTLTKLEELEAESTPELSAAPTMPFPQDTDAPVRVAPPPAMVAEGHVVPFNPIISHLVVFALGMVVVVVLYVVGGEVFKDPTAVRTDTDIEAPAAPAAPAKVKTKARRPR